MKPRYVFNHFAIFDLENNKWNICHKLDKRIPKTVDAYGAPVASHSDLGGAIKMAMENGVKRFDIQIFRSDLPENPNGSEMKSWGSSRIDLPENQEGGDLND